MSHKMNLSLCFILSLYNVGTPDASRRRVGHRVLNENISPDSATLMVEEQYGDGSTVPSVINFVRVGNEWRQALDFDGPAIAKLSTSLGTEHGK
jgi:hypothetical protein